eukprot:COSAG01_NODE_741_length_13888_cov_119.430996_16_plen_122_part_00
MERATPLPKGRTVGAAEGALSQIRLDWRAAKRFRALSGWVRAANRFRGAEWRAAKQSYLYSGGQAIPSGQGVVPVQLSGLHAWLPHASYAAVRGRKRVYRTVHFSVRTRSMLDATTVQQQP